AGGDSALPGAGANVGTVLVPLETHEAAGDACTIDDPDAAAALAIYRGEDAALAGTQLLIDPEGRLRALWYPGRKPDWTDPAALAREIATLRSTPAVGRPTHTGGHMHMH